MTDDLNDRIMVDSEPGLGDMSAIILFLIDLDSVDCRDVACKVSAIGLSITMIP